MNKQVKKIIDKYNATHELNVAITDIDTFRQISENIRSQRLTTIKFSIRQTRSLAFTKMIILGMIDCWVLDTLYVQDGLISGSFFYLGK